MQTNHLARNALQLHAGSSVNLEGTCIVIDTKVTQPGSRPVPNAAKAYVVIRKTLFGPFDSAEAAFKWADSKWPGEDHDVQGLRDPNSPV